MDVDSPHISSVTSDYQEQEVKTDTQATRAEHEAEDQARATEQDVKNKARSTEQEVKREADKLKKKASSAGKEAEKAFKKNAQKLDENRDNPVVWGNALIWGVGAVAIAAAGYQKHKEGKLDWQLAGTVAAGVGAFAVADYFASQYVQTLR